MYFSNDSINGLQISDAYETHDMGIEYANQTTHLDINLAIVSPDMHIYQNEYRFANRSFGEIVSVTYGRKAVNSDLTHQYNFYGRVRASGKFGLDKAQDFTHKVFGLKSVTRINDLVRMPDQLWAGLGVRYRQQLSSSQTNISRTAHAEAYAGTDTVFVNAGYEQKNHFNYATLIFGSNFSFVGSDAIVSAQPVKANARKIIPSIEFGIEKAFSGYRLRVTEHLSMPTIKSDDRMFAVLKADISFEF